MRLKRIARYKNRLALVRKRRSIVRKEVAALLGQKTTDQLSRYERGVTIPNLKTALKLGIIYKIPIRQLLDGYYEACRNEIKRQELESANNSASANSKDIAGDNDLEFCEIEEKLKRRHVTTADLEKAYSHTAKLIRRRAEKMDHI